MRTIGIGDVRLGELSGFHLMQAMSAGGRAGHRIHPRGSADGAAQRDDGRRPGWTFQTATASRRSALPRAVDASLRMLRSRPNRRDRAAPTGPTCGRNGDVVAGHLAAHLAQRRLSQSRNEHYPACAPRRGQLGSADAHLCPTGTAQRKRKAGVVTVVDPRTGVKRGSSNRRTDSLTP